MHPTQHFRDLNQQVNDKLGFVNPVSSSMVLSYGFVLAIKKHW